MAAMTSRSRLRRQENALESSLLVNEKIFRPGMESREVRDNELCEEILVHMAVAGLRLSCVMDISAQCR